MTFLLALALLFPFNVVAANSGEDVPLEADAAEEPSCCSGISMLDTMFSTICNGVFFFLFDLFAAAAVCCCCWDSWDGDSRDSWDSASPFSGLSQASLRILSPSSVADIRRISRFLLLFFSRSSASSASGNEDAEFLLLPTLPLSTAMSS